MRITAVVSARATRAKAPPLVFHKGREGPIFRSNDMLHTSQPKAWVNQTLLIKWIDSMFPLVESRPGRCIIWDSCRAHIAEAVKTHCKRRQIKLIVIPGGMTPYLQAGDIGIYRELKDNMSKLIDAWKKSDGVEYTARFNPKPPRDEIVKNWVSESWKAVKRSTIVNSIRAARFDDYHNWHISKHDAYGEKFINALV